MAAGPGDTILVSGPAGLGPLDPALGAWNVSGTFPVQGGETSNGITPDGRYAVFASSADGLAPGEDAAVTHVFRKDLVTGALTVVDHGANRSSGNPTISDDGRLVAFESTATTLAPGDTTPDGDVFVKDLQTGAVTLITPTAASAGDGTGTLHPVISGNGTKVAFVTGDPLAGASDMNAKSDVYAAPAGGGAFTLVSATSTGSAGNGNSFDPSITGDGSRVAYVSRASDLDNTDDPDASPDAYVRDFSLTGSFLASAQNGNTLGIAAGAVSAAQISGDGSKLAFADTASYVAADGDTLSDVYRRILDNTHTTELMSRATNVAGADADKDVFSPAIDPSGARVAFVTNSTNLGGTGSGAELYVRDTGGNTTTAVTSGAGVVFKPALNGGGSAKAVFLAQNALADGPSPSAIHVASVAGGAPALVSVPPSGQPLRPGLTSVRTPQFGPEDRRLSGDGRFVVFASNAPALGGPSGKDECWRRDLRTGALDLVSVGPGGPANDCRRPTISTDGRRVEFLTNTPLTGDDAHASDSDAYVRDLGAGTTTLASRANGAGGADSDGDVLDAELSGDGSHVAFNSTATNLGVAGGLHAYVRDLGAGTTQIADRDQNGNVEAQPLDFTESISTDGSGARVAFVTTGPLVTADTDGLVDVYVRDTAAGTTSRVDVQGAAAGGANGVGASFNPALSGDGRRVAFMTASQNLDPAFSPWPSGALFETFVRDMAAQTTTLVSRSASGTSAADASFSGRPAIDGAGDVVGFSATPNGLTTNLSAAVTDGTEIVVTRRMSTGETHVVHTPAIEVGLGLGEGASNPALSADGRCLGFFARGRGIVSGLSPDFDQAFVRVLSGDCGTTAAAGPSTPGGGGGIVGTAPRLSRVSLTHRRFRVGPRSTAVSARARARSPVGTTFRFTLSAAATVRIRLERLTPGRRSGKRCVAPTRRLRRHRACTRATLKGTLTRRGLRAGARSVAFSGRVGRRALAVGSYRATLVATDSAGRSSKAVALPFTIVKR